jgi:DHA1 family bicyclomycin/chloramphenicol resistance-like MFS transporter
LLRPDTLALTVLLALLTAVGPLSTDMYLPSLPVIARLFDASPAAVQLTLSAFLLGFAIGQIIYGPISDRYGRKPVLLAAIGLFTLASLACALAPTIETLIAARTLQALGGSGAVVLTRAVVRDLYSGARAARELSTMAAIMALAPIVAPLAGGVLQTTFGWRATFLILVALGLIAAVVVWRMLPETLRERVPEPVTPMEMLRVYGRIAAHRGFRAHLAILTFSFSGLFAWVSGSSFVLQNIYGLTPFYFGLAFGLACVGYLIGTSAAAVLVRRIGIDRTIGIGGAILALGGVVAMASVAFASASAVALVIGIAIYLAGVGFALPQSIAGALSPFPERAGAASSLMGFVQQTSAALLGVLVGQLLGSSAWPVALAIALMGALSLAAWAGTRVVRKPAG